MTQLTDGATAPEFALPDADGRTVRLADHRSRTVVLYFYPAALTPGCTTQAVDFTDRCPGADPHIGEDCSSSTFISAFNPSSSCCRVRGGS